MITEKYPTKAFEDAVQATAYIARVDVSHGELRLPHRVREHLADGDVVVHLLRGEDDVAVHTARLTELSKLVGIDWPADVIAGIRVTVMCPRGTASHDVAVLLPDLPEAQHAAEPESTQGDVAEPDADPVESMSEREADALAFILTGLAEFEQTVFTVDTDQPGPADYDVPTAPLVMTGELELPTPDEPSWPGAEDSEERTDLLPAVVVPDLDEDDDPRTVFSAALVAVRAPAPPPRRAGWLERRIREAARLVLDRSWTATRVIVATASGLVLAGAGLGYVVLAVFQ